MGGARQSRALGHQASQIFGADVMATGKLSEGLHFIHLTRVIAAVVFQTFRTLISRFNIGNQPSASYRGPVPDRERTETDSNEAQFTSRSLHVFYLTLITHSSLQIIHYLT